MAVQKYRKLPVDVEAMEFKNWYSASAIFEWLGGGVLYVPEGAAHKLRKPREEDKTTGFIEQTAPAFLVLNFDGGGEARVDKGCFVVKDEEGVDFWTSTSFLESFEKLE